jgi:hypothetical protein
VIRGGKVPAPLIVEGVDSIVISLRNGVNVGIYSNYESSNRIEHATQSASGN